MPIMFYHCPQRRKHRAVTRDRCTGNIKKIEPSIPKGIETDTKYPFIKMIIQTLQIRFFPYKVPRMAKIAVFSHQEKTVRNQYINYENKRIPTLYYRLTTETKTNKISHFYQSSTYHSTRATREIGSLFSLPNKNNICNGRKHIEILGKTLIHF